VVVSDPLLLGHVIRRMCSDRVYSLASLKSMKSHYHETYWNIKQIYIYTNF